MSGETRKRSGGRSLPAAGYKSLTQLIVAELRDRIFEGAFVPGARLNIAALAKEVDVSPIPVREALRLVEAEGLVEFRPNKGFVVRDLSPAELRELFLVRLPLETLAATEAAAWEKEGRLRALDGILKKMDAVRGSPAWHVLHERFHAGLYALSGMPRLAQMVTGLRGQMRPYAKFYHDDPEQVRHVQAEHYVLLKALKKRDRETIRDVIREHLSRPARLALRRMGAPDEMIAEFALCVPKIRFGIDARIRRGKLDG